jgi:hypothetical protein
MGRIGLVMGVVVVVVEVVVEVVAEVVVGVVVEVVVVEVVVVLLLFLLFWSFLVFLSLLTLYNSLICACPSSTIHISDVLLFNALPSAAIALAVDIPPFSTLKCSRRLLC